MDRWATDDIVKRAVEKPLASEAERQNYVPRRGGASWEGGSGGARGTTEDAEAATVPGPGVRCRGGGQVG